METRVCNTCCENKSINDFAVRNQKLKDGTISNLRRYKCKKCKNHYNRLYNVNNPEKKKKWSNKYKLNNKQKTSLYYLNNKEKISVYAKEKNKIRYTENKEYINNQTKQWASNNKDKVRAISRKANKKKSAALPNHYVITQVKKTSGYSVDLIKEIPQLIDLKRKQIKVKRIKKIIKQQENGK